MELIYLLIFSLLALTSKPIFSLSLRPPHFYPNFSPDVTLFGDAEMMNGGSSVQLTRPIASSSGLLMYSKPFKFLQSKPFKPMSFSTDFTFSISPHPGDGLALVIVPTDFPQKFYGKGSSFGLSHGAKFLGIEFDTSMDKNVGDENANHVGVDVSSLVSTKVSNVSSLNMVLNSGVKLQSWVDYDASSKRLEIRLTEMGHERPYNPLIAFPIDLAEMWKEEEVLVGISSSSGSSAQTSIVFSWSFRTRTVPHWMHSQPVNPQLHADKGHEQRARSKKAPCLLTMLSGLILAIGCGALVAFLLFSLWAIFVNRKSLIPGEYSLNPANFGYKKVSVVVENGSEDVKN